MDYRNHFYVEALEKRQAAFEATLARAAQVAECLIEGALDTPDIETLKSRFFTAAERKSYRRLSLRAHASSVGFYTSYTDALIENYRNTTRSMSLVETDALFSAPNEPVSQRLGDQNFIALVDEMSQSTFEQRDLASEAINDLANMGINTSHFQERLEAYDHDALQPQVAVDTQDTKNGISCEESYLIHKVDTLTSHFFTRASIAGHTLAFKLVNTARAACVYDLQQKRLDRMTLTEQRALWQTKPSKRPALFSERMDEEALSKTGRYLAREVKSQQKRAVAELEHIAGTTGLFSDRLRRLKITGRAYPERVLAC